MNEQLKFSWGHIVAFLSLIGVGYLSFVGAAYLTSGNFAKAGVITTVVVVLLCAVFLGAQMLKATTRKFARRIWMERTLIVLSPVLFAALLFPYFHAWTVHSRDAEIVEAFKGAVETSNGLFTDYEAYANKRIENYNNRLVGVLANRNSNPSAFAACGFTASGFDGERENMVNTLKLMLLSDNYQELKTLATEWIASSCDGASTWNVFVLGNIDEIKQSIHDWQTQLEESSSKQLCNETANSSEKVKPFTQNNLSRVDEGLKKVSDQFTETAFPTVGSIIAAVFLYFALLFPYFLQDRHTKSQFRLIGMEQGAYKRGSINLDITPDEPAQRNPGKQQTPSEGNGGNDYESFTI